MNAKNPVPLARNGRWTVATTEESRQDKAILVCCRFNKTPFKQVCLIVNPFLKIVDNNLLLTKILCKNGLQH